MPNMNGFDAARSLRERYERSQEFKIFLLTGNNVTHHDDYKVFDGILNKPCSLKSLKELLGHLLNN